jgi:MoaA/NifB/PqqE/SkfB family radical SAM enzyme
MGFDFAKRIVEEFNSANLKNIRFSGGEPTLYPGLNELVKLSTAERKAISTNGSADFKVYEQLISDGINDFSISLDACCASTADTMSGTTGQYKTVCDNIRRISKLTYCTVGVVLTPQNLNEIEGIVKVATGLGVSDIRIIPSAQWSKTLPDLLGSLYRTNFVGNTYPILRYRLNNIRQGIPVRGLSPTDNYHCPLVLDDMAIKGNFHYPCIIYLREGGYPVGDFHHLDGVRKSRYKWFQQHDCFKDPICRNSCLDVCRSHNNYYLTFNLL